MHRIDGRTPLGSWPRALLVVATLTLVSPEATRAQDSPTYALDSTTTHAQGSADSTSSSAARRDGWIVGPLLGMAGVVSESDAAMTLGVGATRLVPNRPGLDFSIGTLPQAIPDGLVPIALRIGPSIPLALDPDIFFIPSAGFSAIAVPGYSDGWTGWYWGAAAVMARGPAALRVGVTWHARPGMDSPLWLAEVGFMRVPLPRRAH